MTLKSKKGSYGWGNLNGRSMEGVVFCYDGYEEIIRYIQMRDMHYHPMVMCVSC